MPNTSEESKTLSLPPNPPSFRSKEIKTHLSIMHLVHGRKITSQMLEVIIL